jgi:CheY-like chemotaxis protein
MAQVTETKIKESVAEMLTGTETILLVEDEEMVRNLTRQILTESGYTIVEATNGVEALELCSSGDCKYDLLMTDVVMPEMGGRELSEKLKEILPDLRVLFTSGYTDDAVVRHEVIELNTNFIQKPFSPMALLHKIREILDNPS